MDGKTLPKVSVIVPIYNGERYLRECMDSVIHQTLQEIEIICVNDGSTDGSLEILQEYAKHDSRIRVFDQANAGIGITMNVGIREATGQYIGCVEQDDYVVPEMYERLYEQASQHELDFIKAGDYQFIDEANVRRVLATCPASKKDFLWNKVLNPQKEHTNSIFKSYFVNTIGIYNREFLLRHNIRHNENSASTFQSVGFYFQVLCYAERIMFIPESFYFHRCDNEMSASFSPRKPYQHCIEYDFVRDFLRQHKEFEKQYAPLCAYNRGRSYLWNLKRIGPEHRLDFLRRFSSDFKKIEAAGELDLCLFNQQQRELINEIMVDPELFYEDRLAGKEINAFTNLYELEK